MFTLVPRFGSSYVPTKPYSIHVSSFLQGLVRAMSMFVHVRYKTWTLDWTADWTMDWTVDWTMDWIMDSIVFKFCHLKKTMNAGLPSEQGNGHLYSFQQDWLVSTTMLIQPSSPAGWQGLIGVAL